MKRLCFGLVVLSLFVPVGLRVWSWQAPAVTEIDQKMADAGRELFVRDWQSKDKDHPNVPGDGLGPVFNASSCLECHKQGGVGGGGGLEHNVTTYQAFIDGSRSNSITGILHAKASSPEFLETLNLLDPGLPKTSTPTLEFLKGEINGRSTAVFSQRNTPALFGAKLINEISDREIIAIARKQQLAAGLAGEGSATYPVGRVLFSKDGRAGKFGWKGQTPSLLDFVQGACANELGLSNPGNPQPKPISQPNYKAPAEHDLTLEQCKEMEMFIASLPRPEQRLPNEGNELANVHRGEALFGTMGCAVCHVPTIGSVQGIYSDLLLHRMGKELEARGHYYGPESSDPESTPQPDEWRTPPLWGVADSGPWMHDGRAATLEEAIRQHGGQASVAAARFARATPAEREMVVGFLKTLRAPGAN